MCGVAAIFGYLPAAPPVDIAELRRIVAHMVSRGPDGGGLWTSTDLRCALSHRRLAIIDPEPRAAQPMVSACGRYVLSFNGEIYNYRALREELVARGCALRTKSDTEVLLEHFVREGEACLQRLRGMFAFALWDVAERVLWLARDPYGIKPLYYADDGRAVRASSQVKALLAGGALAQEPESAGVVGFFLLGSVPEPFTCWRNIRAVPAGSSVRVDARGAHPPQRFACVASLLRQAELTDGDNATSLHEAFLDSVRDHLVADVPVGTFLSAGIDSGALLSLVAEARGGSATGVRAITVTYPEYRGTAGDEAPLAAHIAQSYGAEHACRLVDEAEFVADLPRILEAMDQPTIDGVNTWFVSKAAREAGLKVALSGLGGDELLGGYGSFRDISRWVRRMALPSRLPLLGRATRQLLAPVAERWRLFHPKLAGMAELGGTWPGAYLLRRGLFMPWELTSVLEPDFAIEGLRRLQWEERLAEPLRDGPTSDFGRVASLESCLYLRNQLLRDTDWASMAHSVEVRVPLVDLPLLRATAPRMIARPTLGKRALFENLARPLPSAVLARAKTGFTTPAERWICSLTDLPAAPGASREPTSRRWARLVARSQLPNSILADGRSRLRRRAVNFDGYPATPGSRTP